MKRWLKHIYYISKHREPSDGNILRLLMPPVAGIALCMACLAGSTWAQFSASVRSGTQTIQAANYGISAEVTDEEDQPVSPGQEPTAGQADTVEPTAGQADTVELTVGKKYTVKLTATGTAPGGGYCEVKVGDDTYYYTNQILPDEEEPFTFTLIPEKNCDCTFTAIWGQYSGGADRIANGGIIGKETLENPEMSGTLTEIPEGQEYYTVHEGDTLENIAQKFGTTVEKLLAFNGIEDHEDIEIGGTIKIPPVDYEIPSTPDVSDSEDEPVQQPGEPEEPAEETPSQPDVPTAFQESAGSTGSEPPAP